MKSKRFFRITIFGLIAVLMLCTPFAMIKNIKSSSYAATSANHFTYSVQGQGQKLVLDSIVRDGNNGEYKLYLYSNGGLVTDIKNAFEVKKSHNYGTKFNTTENELSLRIDSASSAVNANCQFISTINFSNNIIIAANAGFVSADASAFVSSSKGVYSFLGSDPAESVEMQFYIYNSNNTSSSVNKNTGYEVREDYKASPDQLSIGSSELINLSANTLELIFVSSYSKGGMTSSNNLKIKLPELVFRTTDLISPSLELSGGSDVWAKERVLSLTGSDNESGIYKVEVSKNGGEWETAVDFTENNTDLNLNSTGDFTLTENGTYRFRAVDNVGNVSAETTYIESHIDNIAPSIEVDNLTGFYNTKTLTFSANMLANDSLSQNTFNYVVSKDAAVVYSSELAAQNSFTAPENGEYTISFYATDEAGNASAEISYSLYFVDIDIDNFFTTNEVYFNASIIDGFSYSYEIVKDGLVISNSAFVNGSNSLTLSENGKYSLTFNFYAKSAENSYTILSKNIDIDNSLYHVTTSAVNGTITPSFSSPRASGMVLEFAPNEGYELYMLLVNGEAKIVDPDATSYIYELDKDLVFEAKFRKVISVSVSENYVYNYGNLDLIYESEISEKLINFEISDAEGNIISDISAYQFEVGTYLVSYSINTEEFGGRGSINIQILPKTVYISNIVSVYKFAESGTNFVFESSETQANIYAKFYKNGVLSDFAEAGEYSYEFATDNKNFVVSCTGNAVIIPNITSVYDNVVVYDGNAQTLKFTGSMSDITLIFVEYYFNGELITNPTNVGIYNAKFYYAPSSNIYEIETSEEFVLEITKRRIEVSVQSIEHEYDGTIPEPKYLVKNMADNENYDFQLICDLNVNVGNYEVKIARVPAGELLNYEIVYNDGFVKITKRTLTILATEGLSKEYSSVDPELTYSFVGGLLEGDTFSLTLTREAGENVGYYSILAKEFVAENYELNFISTKFQITKRLGFVSLKNYSKVYGDNDPAYDFIRINTNILDDDIADILNAITREAGEDVGSYKISIDQKLVQNYVLITKDATLTILKRDIVVVADRVVTTYGEEKELTFSADNMIFGDTLLGSLSRESGKNVGTYKINIGSLSSKNYNIIDFVSADYVIEKRVIDVEAISSNKTYGEADNLEYSVTNLAFGDTLSGSLSREAGEDVGEYAITIGSLSASSNYEINFVSGTYQIIPAEIEIVIDSKVKMYGEEDEMLTYSVSNVNANLFNIKLVREAGENVGTYEIKLADGQNFKNYIVVSVNYASYEIVKAKVNAVLNNKEVTYSGEAHAIDPLSISGIEEFEIEYVYYDFGEVMGALPVDARAYSVKAIFAGNENFEAFETNLATLKINKKFLPITITKQEFVYDGEAKVPEFNVNLDVDFMPYAEFADGSLPTEIGSYPFTFNLNMGSGNYYYDESDEFKAICVLKIVSPFSNSNGNASVSTNSPNYSGAKLQIVENSDSSLKSIFSSSVDGRRCISVYSFRNTAGYENYNDILTISIKATRAGKNVELYLVDKYGNVTPVSYELIDGYYVLSVNDTNSSILVTVTDKTAFYSKIFIFVMVLAITYYVSKTIRKRKNNNFFNKNTKMRKISEKEFSENKEIVEAQIIMDEPVSIDSFLS